MGGLIMKKLSRAATIMISALVLVGCSRNSSTVESSKSEVPSSQSSSQQSTNSQVESSSEAPASSDVSSEAPAQSSEQPVESSENPIQSSEESVTTSSETSLETTSEASYEYNSEASNQSSSEVETSSSTSIDKPWTKGETIQGDPWEVEISDEKISEYASKMERGKALAQQATDFNAFIDIYDDLDEYYSLCQLAINSNMLKNDVYGLDEDEEQYLTYSEIATQVEQWFNEVEHICANNAFKRKLFAGMSDQEIQNYIGVELPQAYYDAQNKTNQLIADYYNLENGKDYYDNLDILYKQLHEAEKTIATYLGYDNYLDYCYENTYGRDYSPSDTDSYFANVYKYAIPAYENLSDELEVLKSRLTTNERKTANTILHADAFVNCFEYIEDYADYMGGFFKQEFNGLFTENGHYNISYEDNGTPGAYEYEFPYGNGVYNYVFYGPGYHDSISIVHEFGHYLAGQANPLSIASYDLAETQSQADEFMFLQYLAQFGDYGFSDNLKQYIVDYYLVDDIFFIVIPALVNEVEKLVYAGDYELGDLEAAVDLLYEQYPALNDFYDKEYTYEYCADVTMYSAGYYISYSTSLLGALNINKIATNNYQEAKDAYLKLIELDGNFGYLDAYQYAGLGDPFEENTFKYIFG